MRWTANPNFRALLFDVNDFDLRMLICWCYSWGYFRRTQIGTLSGFHLLLAISKSMCVSYITPPRRNVGYSTPERPNFLKFLSIFHNNWMFNHEAYLHDLLPSSLEILMNQLLCLIQSYPIYRTLQLISHFISFLQSPIIFQVILRSKTFPKPTFQAWFRPEAKSIIELKVQQSLTCSLKSNFSNSIVTLSAEFSRHWKAVQTRLESHLTVLHHQAEPWVDKYWGMYLPDRSSF